MNHATLLRSVPPEIGTTSFTVINVTDHGATGNGTTDDTAAINRALAAVPNGPAPTPTGAIVYFPAGTYLISSPLIRLASWTRCVGEGKSATTILVNPADWADFVSPTNPTLGFVFDITSTSVTDCSVMDLTINGRAGGMENPTLNYAGGIYCTEREIIERVSFLDIWGWAVWLTQVGAEAGPSFG